MTISLNPNSTSVLIPRADGKVLACSRKDDENAFGLPGGKVDKSDLSLLGAALRELEEETGIYILPTMHGMAIVGMGPMPSEQDAFGMKIIPIHSGLCVGGASGKTYMNHCFMVIGGEKYITPKQIKGEGRVAWIDPELLFFGPFQKYNRKLFDHIGYDFDLNRKMVADRPGLVRKSLEMTEQELLEKIEVV